MLDYAKQNHVDPMGSVGFAWYKRFNMLNYGYATAAKAYNEAKTRKELLDSRPDTSTCWPCWRRNAKRVSIRSRKGPSAPMNPAVVSKGMELDIFVEEDPSLKHAGAGWSGDGTINYPGIGAVPADGLTTQVLPKHQAGTVGQQAGQAQEWGDMVESFTRMSCRKS